MMQPSMSDHGSEHRFQLSMTSGGPRATGSDSFSLVRETQLSCKLIQAEEK